jgi:hypothetical protein
VREVEMSESVQGDHRIRVRLGQELKDLLLLDGSDSARGDVQVPQQVWQGADDFGMPGQTIPFLELKDFLPQVGHGAWRTFDIGVVAFDECLS